ncbi:MAG: hypothetical protein H7145_02610 [Akkermansiaceae bacterium]|nr:hypothetical protein [Armatimonadota bacterium]
MGDPVVARNADTGKTEWKRVTAVHSRTAYEVVYLHLAGSGGKVVETLGTTAEHPFLTPGGWVDAGSLGIGTEIVTRARPSLVVSKVERVAKPEGVTVYNLTVDGDHTYFVGGARGGLLSHNAKPCKRFLTYAFENQGEVVYIGKTSGTSKNDGAVMNRRLIKGSGKNIGPNGKVRHDHWLPETGDGWKILEEHWSDDASSGAEEIWMQRYRDAGAPLRNEKSGRDTKRSDALARTGQTIGAYLIQLLQKRIMDME